MLVIIMYYISLYGNAKRKIILEKVLSDKAVETHLDAFSAGHRIRSFPSGTSTVERAAAALGVEPDMIAKTLALRVKGTDRVMTIVAKGTARLDNAKFKAAFGGKASFLSGDECEAVTGHPPGGVCPFGLKDGVEVYLDESLKGFSVVYPAAGKPDNCVDATLDELELWSRGIWIDVCR